MSSISFLTFTSALKSPTVAFSTTLENGIAKSFVLANGSLLHTCSYELTLSILDISYDTTVYFALYEDLTRDVLGRNGFLYLLKIAIVDYDSALYISKYDYSP